MIKLVEVVALVGGIVHSMVPGTEPGPATVLIEDGAIVAVGTVDIPKEAELVDVTGLHVIPGLVDGMMNFDGEHDALYVAAGVTTARDVGNDLDVILEAQIPARRDLVPGPSLIICGRVLDGSKGISIESLVVTTPESVESKLGELLRLVEQRGVGIDFLSILESMPPAVYPALLAFGKEKGLPVWGPRLPAVSLEQAVGLGQAGFLGLQALLPPGTHWGNVTPEALQPGMEIMAKGSSAIVPMLGVYSRILVERGDYEKELAYLSPTYETRWQQQLAAWRQGLVGDARSDLQTALDLQRSVVLQLWENGVPLLPGSGAPNPWLMPGGALVGELIEFAAAGIPNSAVLHLATAGAAEILGHADTFGRIAPGLRADLVVLGGDPRESLDYLREPEIVVLRGQILERGDLIARSEDLLKVQAGVREVASAPLLVPPPDAPEGELLVSGRAEVWALNQRQSGEHFQVLRQPDGAFVYCSRIRSPGTANSVASEMRTRQVIRNGILDSFRVQLLERPDGWDAPEPLTPDTGTPEQVAASDRSLVVEGLTLGTNRSLTVQRSQNGIFIDNKPAADVPGLLDVSLMLNAMIVARHFPVGESYAISLEGNALLGATDRWRLAVREDDRLLQVVTSRGALAFAVDAKGQPLFAARERGTDKIEVRVLEFDTHGGPGLGLGQARTYQVDGKAVPASASTKAAGKSERSQDK